MKLAGTLFALSEIVLIVVLVRANYIKHHRKSAIVVLISFATSLLLIWRILLPVSVIPAAPPKPESGEVKGGQIVVAYLKFFKPDHELPFVHYILYIR